MLGSLTSPRSLDQLFETALDTAGTLFTNTTGPANAFELFMRSLTGGEVGAAGRPLAKPADGFAALQAAAEAGDERAFVAARRAMDWRACPPDDYARAVRLALEAGAHLAARQLAAEGAQRYPAHADLQKYARVLAPPRIIRADLPPDPTIEANVNWLKAHRSEFRGQWIALRGGQLLGAARSLNELVARVGDVRGTGILVTAVQ